MKEIKFRLSEERFEELMNEWGEYMTSWFNKDIDRKEFYGATDIESLFDGYMEWIIFTKHEYSEEQHKRFSQAVEKQLDNIRKECQKLEDIEYDEC